MGWRELTDDARRFHFWLTLLAGLLAALAAGVYWDAWSRVAGLAPPLRALAVLIAMVLAFVLWYLGVFTSHRYFGYPKANPFALPTRPDPASIRKAAASAAPALAVSAPDSHGSSPQRSGSLRTLSSYEALASAERAYEEKLNRERLSEFAKLTLSDSELTLLFDHGEGRLSVRVTNLTPVTLRECRLTLIDLRLWSDIARAFVETSTFHRHERFNAIQLRGPNDIFHGKPADFDFMSWGTSSPTVYGVAFNEREIVRLPIENDGVWRASFALRVGDRSRIQNLCFVWHRGYEPVPTKCSVYDEARRESRERIRLLVDLAEFAISRLINDPQNDDAWSLQKRIRAWESQVLVALSAAGATESDLSRFRILTRGPSSPPPADSDELGRIRQELAERIDRLRIIARRLEEQSPQR